MQDGRAVKRKGAAKKNGGGLSFLPEPQNPIPVRDEPVPEPSSAPTTSTIELFPTAETAEMYRIHDGGETASQAAPAQDSAKCAPYNLFSRRSYCTHPKLDSHSLFVPERFSIRLYFAGW